MARKFNLQPWREIKRQQQRKIFFKSTSLLILLVVVMLAGYYFLYKQYIDSQEAAIDKLNKDIALLKKSEEEVKTVKAFNERLTREIATIQVLQTQRSFALELLNYIALNIPQTVFLNSISLKDHILTISGVSEDESGISNFLRKLQSFSGTLSARLVSITKAKSTDRYEVSERTEVKDFVIEVFMRDMLVKDK